MCTPKAIVQAVKDAGAFFCHVKVNNSYDGGYDEELDTPTPISISLYISGGDDIEIARAIYNTKPIGVCLNGDFKLDIGGCSISWYNLNYVDYTFQKQAQNKANRKLEKEYLLQRLAELEGEED